jgi:hypothetical protein
MFADRGVSANVDHRDILSGSDLKYEFVVFFRSPCREMTLRVHAAKTDVVNVMAD